jgi:hypothetical protein
MVGPADLVSAHLVCHYWHSCILWAETTTLQLWRTCYFNTWPPPLASSLHLVKKKEKKEEVVPVDWKKVSLQRLALARHGALALSLSFCITPAA